MTDLDQPTTSVGALARWKLTEPVRLYLWPALLVLGTVLVLAAVGSGEWAGLLLDGPLLVMLLGAGEAARASVYSPKAVLQAVMRARQQ